MVSPMDDQKCQLLDDLKRQFLVELMQVCGLLDAQRPCWDCQSENEKYFALSVTDEVCYLYCAEHLITKGYRKSSEYKSGYDEMRIFSIADPMFPMNMHNFVMEFIAKKVVISTEEIARET